MLVKLIRDSRISHKAGDIVDVDPAHAAFLMEVGSAVPETVKKDTEAKAKPEPEPKKKRTVKK